MPEAGKILGQSSPLAATLTDLYVVPALTQTIVSTFTVANRSVVATSFRMSCAPAGAADDVEQYPYYDIPIRANDSFAATFGITLATTDVIRIYATLATLSFNLFGVERT